MKIRDYFRGQHFQLRSSLSAGTVAERINEAAGSPLSLFTSGVVGGVWAGHLRLRYRSSPFEYNAKPVLAGRLHEASHGSTLSVRYRAPGWVYGFYLFWYLFLAFVAVGLVANGWAPEVTGGNKAMAVAIYALLLVAPIGFHAIGTRRSEEDLADLLDFLGQHAEARG